MASPPRPYASGEHRQSPNLSRYRSVRKAAAQPREPSQPFPPITTANAPSAFTEQQPSSTIQRSRSRYHQKKPVQPPDSSFAAAHGQQEHAISRPSPRPAKNGNGGVRVSSRPHDTFLESSPPSLAQSPANGAPHPIGLPVRTKSSKEAFVRVKDIPVNDPDGRAKRQARRMMDSEAERHKRMHAKIKADKEEQRLRQIREMEEQRLIEEEQIRAAKEAEEERLRAARAKRETEELEKRKRREQEAERRADQRDRNKRQVNRETTQDNSRKELKDSRHGGPNFAHEDTQRPVTTSRSTDSAPKRSSSKELFGFLKRKRGGSVLQKGSFVTGPDINKDNRQDPQRQRSSNLPGPGMDAPISAVNAGERQVLVEYGRYRVYLPVTPTTTPIDLMNSASTCLNQNLDTKTSVLLEYFSKVGIQRPLRRYELIRHVLNSWDDDKQNVLILVPSATGGRDPELEVSSVGSTEPSETRMALHYSQRPGKWDKRHVTLRSDGQIVISKKADAKEKDTTNVCRVSDYDIYSPSPDKLLRSIRPPKKHCFVIKSQQKSAMFESIEDYVHCFCTNDRRLAASWYNAVQSWRSWYLVNILCEGKQNSNTESHLRGVSDSSHYQIGSFKPLIDLDMFNKPSDLERSGTHRRSASYTRNQSRSRAGPGYSAKASGAPPSSFARYNGNDAEQPTSRGRGSNPSNTPIQDAGNAHGELNADDTAFASGGLLGRSYSTRQKTAQQSAEVKNGKSMEQGRPSMQGGLSRAVSSSRRDVPRPLVDLTPTYQPPPQHAKKGRGYFPEEGELGPGGVLIDAATSPDEPEVNRVPAASDWRGRSAAAETGAGGGAGGMISRAGSTKVRPGTAR